MDVQWQYRRGQGVVYVMFHYGMAVWGQGLHWELWYVVDANTIKSALHGAKQVVIKVGDMYALVDNQMVNQSSQWMIILKYRRLFVKVYLSKFWFIATDCHRAVIVINY